MRQEQRTYWIFSSLKNFLRCQRCFLWGSKTKGEISMSGLVMVGIQVTFWHVSLLITWNLITMELSSFSAQPVQKSNHLVISDLWKIFQPPNELMWFSTPSKNIMNKKQNGNLPGGMNTKDMWNHHLFWEMSPLPAWAWLSVKHHPEWCLTKHLLANIIRIFHHSGKHWNCKTRLNSY